MELNNISSNRVVHLSKRGRASTLPTSPTSSDSTTQPSSAATTSSSLRQHQCDQLPHLCRQHSSNINSNPSQRSRRFNFVPLLLRAHRNIKLNMDKIQQMSRLHRIGANNWLNGGPNVRVGLRQQHHSGRLNINVGFPS